MNVDRAETNKQNVQDFYDLMFNQCRPLRSDRPLCRRRPTFSTTPHVGDGKKAFIDYFERMAAEYPGQAGRVHAHPSPRKTTTSCSTVDKPGQETPTTTRASTSSGSTPRTARSSNTGTFRSCPRSQQNANTMF